MESVQGLPLENGSELLEALRQIPDLFDKNFGYDVAFQNRMNRVSEQHSVTPEEILPLYEKYVQRMWSEISECLPAHTFEEIASKISVGVLHGRSLNAACVPRNGPGPYALVFSLGLAVFLAVASELVTAVTLPDAIKRLTPMPHGEVSKDFVVRYYLEFTEEFRQANTIIDRHEIALNASATARNSVQLRVWEAFCLCHEAAHVVCIENGFTASLGRDTFPRIDFKARTEESRQNERAADVVAYCLLRTYFYRHLCPKSPTGEVKEDDRDLVRFISSFFDLLTLVDDVEHSHTHPRPIERMISILASVYRPALGDILLRSLDDPTFRLELYSEALHPRTDLLAIAFPRFSLKAEAPPPTGSAGLQNTKLDP